MTNCATQRAILSRFGSSTIVLPLAVAVSLLRLQDTPEAYTFSEPRWVGSAACELSAEVLVERV